MSEYYSSLEERIFSGLRAKIKEEVDFEYLKQLELADYKPVHNNFKDAAKSGNLIDMKWLKANGYKFDRRTFAYAAKSGNLDNMKWLKASGCKFSNLTFANDASIYKKL
jgi:hypothetical protein